MVGPDPLGKRALFWVTPQEDGKDSKHPAFDEGRRAFYTNATGRSMTQEGTGRPVASRTVGGKPKDGGSTGSGSKGGSSGSGSTHAKRRSAHAISRVGGGMPRGNGLLHGADGATEADGATGISRGKRSTSLPETARTASRLAGTGPGTKASGTKDAKESCTFGVFCVDITCGSCKADTTVRMAEFLRMHCPVWLWLPGKGNTHLLVCPSCHKRTWVSVSWPSSGTGSPAK
ncbi:MAG: hypothetical protein M1420_01865 [Actinobacteria bacterium]|jgi:hypothetical protein|nr:hypothetical protein [Actinomycetota bacterium]